jgi:ribokinase
MSRILVVGSINMDIVNRVHRHPQPGETIKGISTVYSNGGKGANQAVAAALAGSEVSMIGAVGDDAFGKVLVDALHQSGIKTDGISVISGSSGLAFITVAESGENHIVLSEGANGKLLPDHLESFKASIEQAELVLLQNEIPWAVNRAIMDIANKAETRVYYNPAPASPIPAYAIPLIDTLILNESEAEQLTGMKVENPSQAQAAAEVFMDLGVDEVIITLGQKGLVYMDQQDNLIEMPAFAVTAVDSTAAGDTFIGAYASAAAKGEDKAYCLRFASAAAAISVTRQGAQPSIPKLDEILSFLQ